MAAVTLTLGTIAAMALTPIAGYLGWKGGEELGKIINNIKGGKNSNDEADENPYKHIEATETPTKEEAITAFNNIKNAWADKFKSEATEENTPVPPVTETPKLEGSIQDTTNESLGQNTQQDINWMDLATQWRNEQWAREDAIRAETQAREDNAWVRSVADMKAAGINPNLVNATPAASGGGITQATGIDTSTITTDMQNNIELIQQLIDNNFTGNQNDKDRLMQSIGNLLQFGGMLALALGRKK